MIILTGGAGFVGGNILKELNSLGEENVLVVDNLTKSDKYENLLGARFHDYVDKDDFYSQLEKGAIRGVTAIFHQGACTNTMEYDGRYMMRNNFDYSKKLLHLALEESVPFIYASSAAVYGHTELAQENAGDESPLNVYGYSKYLFDVYARELMPRAKSSVVGLRYFNVYGRGEAHKGKMSSMVLQLYHQILRTGKAKLFGSFGDFAPGEQTRDFIYVKDIVRLNMHFWQRDSTQTVVNAGTGSSRTWNDLGRAVISAVGAGQIEYIDFPEALADKYQFNTRADLNHLRSLGFDCQFCTLEDGVRDYIGRIQESKSRRARS